MTTEEQVKLYCEQKTEESRLNKSNKQLNATLKQILIEQVAKDKNATDITAGKYTVHLVIKQTEDIDEVKMLSILKDFWKSTKGEEKCPFIGTVEYIDMDALESFMYKEELPKEVILALDGCRTKKEDMAITYKIAKGE